MCCFVLFLSTLYSLLSTLYSLLSTLSLSLSLSLSLLWGGVVCALGKATGRRYMNLKDSVPSAMLPGEERCAGDGYKLRTGESRIDFPA